MLGRHVLQRAGNLSFTCESRDQSGIGFFEWAGLLRQAEVEQFHALLGDQNVSWFEVAMGDAFLMGGVKRVEDLSGVFDRGVCGQRALERLAFKVFHDEVVGTDIVQRTDIGMVERGHGTGFAFEALVEIGLGDFQGDRAVEPGVAGFPHFAHAPFANMGEDLEGAEFVARG